MEAPARLEVLERREVPRLGQPHPPAPLLARVVLRLLAVLIASCVGVRCVLRLLLVARLLPLLLALTVRPLVPARPFSCIKCPGAAATGIAGNGAANEIATNAATIGAIRTTFTSATRSTDNGVSTAVTVDHQMRITERRPEQACLLAPPNLVSKPRASV